LRKTIRRRPCSYILLTNAIILCVLTALIGITVYFITNSQTKLAQYEREENILKSKKNQVTFQYCAYEDKPSPFHTDYCQDNCGVTAFAWRERKLKNNITDLTCLDWREQIKCHDKTHCPARREHIPECAGVYDQPTPSDASTTDKTVIAQAITNETLGSLMNTSILANQLVVHCPRCEAQTNLFRFQNDEKTCYRKLSTTSNGWPSEFHFCDLLEKAVTDNVTNCPTIHIDNPLKSGDNQ